MLKLSDFSHNPHSSRAKMVAENIKRGISVEEVF